MPADPPSHPRLPGHPHGPPPSPAAPPRPAAPGTGDGTSGRGLQPWRRVFHVANGLLVAWGPGILGLSRTAVVGVLAVIVLLLLAGDVARLRRPRLNALFFRAFPSLASARERDRTASSTWYALGALTVWLVFPAPLAVAALLVLALADPAASVLGRLLGRRRVGTGTLEGSLVFTLVAWAVLTPTAGWAAGLVVALGAAVAEVVPWRVDDNLAVPVVAASLLWLVGV